MAQRKKMKKRGGSLKQQAHQAKKGDAARTAAGRAAITQRVHTIQAAFLEAFMECGIIGQALEAVDRSRGAFSGWKRNYPEFLEAFEQAKSIYAEKLEKNVLAIANNESHRSQLTANIFMLKALKPETYRDNYSVEVNGKMGVSLSAIRDEDLDARIVAAERRLQSLESSGDGKE